MTVHPRPRGEHVTERAESAAQQRFIPAHAGNTNWLLAAWTSSAVHPRPRGEHDPKISPDHCKAGSSPPTRGTPGPWPQRRFSARFIPAHAGNTFPPPVWCSGSSVHPRPRGEHQSSGFPPAISCGSSPPTRGTRALFGSAPNPERFIPAHAGNTCNAWMISCSTSVHPRPRGEHSLHSRPVMDVSGSSPPTRGTPDRHKRREFVQRFIPAHAGNTAGQAVQALAVSVHPRPRGEHNTDPTIVVTIDGSSPPTRGTPPRYAGGRLSHRFIPAHAGNTIWMRWTI